MNYVDLFSGIGGFALGAYWAGMRFDSHYFSEIDPWASELYQKRFPDAIPLGDIRGIDGKALADAECNDDWTECESGEFTHTGGARGTDWIITGGFPCQDISVAGKGTGIRGERSGLWFEYWRIIRDIRPRFAIMENVGALTFRGLTDVLGSLAEIGYDAEWQDIRASDVGAPHRRERIWIVAYPSSDGRQQTGIRRQESSGATGEAPSADSDSPGLAIGQGEDSSRERTDGGAVFGRISRWAVEPAIRGMASRLPDELDAYQGRLAHKSFKRVDRLRGLGNSIVPQIAELLFRQIKEMM